MNVTHACYTRMLHTNVTCDICTSGDVMLDWLCHFLRTVASMSADRNYCKLQNAYRQTLYNIV